MLALKPSTMAPGQQQSAHPSSGYPEPDQQQSVDPNVPFGYYVNSSQGLLFEDAPEPPGAPLLTDSDTKFLSSFFEGMTTEPLGGPSYGEGLNFSDDWFESLPPQFMGTATSYGQQPNPLGSPALGGAPHDGMRNFLTDPAHNLLPQHQSGPPPPSLDHPSDDVHFAATVLQNGSMSRPNGHSHHHHHHYQHSNSHRPTVPNLMSPVGNGHHQNLHDLHSPSFLQSAVDHDNAFAVMVLGSGVMQPSSSRQPRQMEPQWGSDTSFTNGQSFLPPSHKETAEALSQAQIEVMRCLEVAGSAATTRPSSPVLDGRSSLAFQLKTRTSPPRPLAQPVVENDIEAPPKKRRKSKAKPEEDPEPEESVTPKSARKRKTTKLEVPPQTPAAATVMSSNANSTGVGAGLGADSGSKRRKSAAAAAAAKQPRENLTEEQKRENHIKSEQKRRTLIKDGYDDLSKIVPGLHEGGFSKSTLLTMAGDWLVELVEGNKLLEDQLEPLENGGASA